MQTPAIELPIQTGDLVYAARDLYNDPVEETGESGIPGAVPGELLIASGVRGVVINVGHSQEAPDDMIYLVRFEFNDGQLAMPIGCLEGEISHEAPVSTPA